MAHGVCALQSSSLFAVYFAHLILYASLMSSSLKLVTKHFNQYCEGIAWNTGVNCFWIIHNMTEVLNGTKGTEHFDFSTLYTNIPHDLA